MYNRNYGNPSGRSSKWWKLNLFLFKKPLFSHFLSGKDFSANDTRILNAELYYTTSGPFVSFRPAKHPSVRKNYTPGVASLNIRQFSSARVFLPLLLQRQIRDCPLPTVLPTAIEHLTVELLVRRF